MEPPTTKEFRKFWLTDECSYLSCFTTTYAKGGDYENAVINEEKAILEANTALKEGKMIGTVMDYTVKEYQEALAEYKKKVKKKA